jgi:CMP-N-acetylneuraminic acid synthetase
MVWCTTDDVVIQGWCLDNGVHIIDRPKHLSESDSSHHDVMIHALKEIEQKPDYVILLLGNSAFTTTSDLESAIAMLDDNPTATSIISVTEFNMFNPFRAFKIVEGFMVPFLEDRNVQLPSNANDRNAFGSSYFFNGSFCVCKYDTMMSKINDTVYSWIGNKPKAFIQNFAMELDEDWQISVIRNLREQNATN